MSPVTWLSRLSGRILSRVHMRNFTPVTEMRKGAKILGTSYGAKFEKENKHGETKSHYTTYFRLVMGHYCLTFAPDG